jgi:hypothetical protein
MYAFLGCCRSQLPGILTCLFPDDSYPVHRKVSQFGLDKAVGLTCTRSLFAALFGNIVGALMVALPATCLYLIDWDSRGLQAIEQGENSNDKEAYNP